MILLVHADTTTNERRAVEHVDTHVRGIHMLVLYTVTAVQIYMLGAVRGCSCVRPCVGKSIPIFCLSAETLCPFCFARTGASVL